MALSREEKNTVLNIIHNSKLTSFIFEGIEYKLGKDKSSELNFEALLDGCEELAKAYSELNHFSWLEDFSAKKSAIQLTISKYISYVTFGITLAQNKNFDSFFDKAGKNWGVGTLQKLIKKIHDNEHSGLIEEFIPDAEDRTLLQFIFAIDIFLHLPERILENSLQAQKTKNYFTFCLQNKIDKNIPSQNEKTSSSSPLPKEQKTSTSSPLSKNPENNNNPHFQPSIFFNNSTSTKKKESGSAPTLLDLNQYMNQTHELQKYYKTKVYADTLVSKDPLFSAIVDEEKSLEELKTLLKKNPGACHKVDKDGNNLLHLAAFNSSEKVGEIVRMLIDVGCDPSAYNKHGLPPLHMAIMVNSHQNYYNTLMKLAPQTTQQKSR